MKIKLVVSYKPFTKRAPFKTAKIEFDAAESIYFRYEKAWHVLAPYGPEICTHCRKQWRWPDQEICPSVSMHETIALSQIKDKLAEAFATIWFVDAKCIEVHTWE